MVTSMMVNFLLMCVTLITIPAINPILADKISVIRNRTHQLFIGILGLFLLLLFLVVHVHKDLTSSASNWYFHSTPVWLIVMVIGSIIFLLKWREIGKKGHNEYDRFKVLP